MILVDTNVIINFWRNPSQKSKDIFLAKDLAICGVVKAELIHGAQNKRDIQRIQAALTGFEYIPIDEAVWNQMGNFLYQLRRKGISVPFQDVLIAALAINQKLVLWSEDKHFQMIQRVFPELNLFGM